MRSTRRIGKAIGLLIFAQLAIGLPVIFVLLRPLSTTPGFLESAAESPLQLGVAVLLSLGTGALAIGIAITAWPVYRRYCPTMALWFLSLSVVSFSLVAVANAAVMSMLSLSREYATAAAPEGELFAALAVVAGSTRYWTQLIAALVGEGTVFVHFGILYRSALIPRPLSVLGLVTVGMKILGVALPFLGHQVVLAMVLPMVLSYLALALWLMAKGFEERLGSS